MMRLYFDFLWVFGEIVAVVFLLIERKRGTSLRWWTPGAMSCSVVWVSKFIAKYAASLSYWNVRLVGCTSTKTCY